MKLSLQQLATHLTKPLAPLYLISGDETLLTQEAMDMIRTSAHQQGFAERVRISIDSPAEWSSALYSQSHNFSLFATKRLLELDLLTAKINAAAGKILQEYVQQSPADTILMIRTAKLDSKIESSSWYKALDKIGVMITVWPVSSEQLPAWITQRAKKLNLVLTQAATHLLAHQVEGNLLAASQELEKLSLLQLSNPVNETQISECFADNAHFDIFALVDSFLVGNQKRSLRILRNLAAEDIEPTLVLWALTREIRTLANMSQQVEQGVTLSALFPKYRIWEKRQPLVRAFLQRNKRVNCWNLLVKAAQIDRIIKGAESGDVWREFEKFVVG